MYFWLYITLSYCRYIKERKEALKKEQEAKAAAKYSDCPDGHIPLPDNERKDTLSMLKKSEFILKHVFTQIVMNCIINLKWQL